MTESNLPISEATLRRLSELAEWTGTSPTEALEQAVKAQHDRQFWNAVDAGYAALRSDEKEWSAVEAERREWDGTLLDGLDRSERWAPDRSVHPSADHGKAS